MNWNELLSDLLYAVIITAVPVITGYLVKYLKAHFDKISEETDQFVIGDTLNEVLDIITTVVNSTSQTYVDSLKSAGEFTKESQKIAFNTTKEKILELLSEESKELIKMLYQDVDKWLDVQIESTVRALKY